MTRYDQTTKWPEEAKTTPPEGPNQLSHLFYRHDPNDRHNHDQRHGRAGAAETEVTAQMQVTPGPTYLPTHRAAYDAALAFVDAAEPDPHIHRLSRHFRNRRGELLLTLNEVVTAALTGELAAAG